jgi:hypothetical protein
MGCGELVFLLAMQRDPRGGLRAAPGAGLELREGGRQDLRLLPCFKKRRLDEKALIEGAARALRARHEVGA